MLSTTVESPLTTSLKSWLQQKLAPPYTDGWTGGGSRPTRIPLIASAFGDTDGEIFGRTIFRPKKNSAENFFGRKIFRPKIFRPKIFSAETFFGRKFFRPKVFSTENVFGRKHFWRKISPSVSPKAEAIGEVPGGSGSPPRSARPSGQ